MIIAKTNKDAHLDSHTPPGGRRLTGNQLFPLGFIPPVLEPDLYLMEGKKEDV